MMSMMRLRRQVLLAGGRAAILITLRRQQDMKNIVSLDTYGFSFL